MGREGRGGDGRGGRIEEKGGGEESNYERMLTRKQRRTPV